MHEVCPEPPPKEIGEVCAIVRKEIASLCALVLRRLQNESYPGYTYLHEVSPGNDLRREVAGAIEHVLAPIFDEALRFFDPTEDEVGPEDAA